MSILLMPVGATDDSKRYAYACRLQQSLINQFNVEGLRYVGTEKWHAFALDHRARMFAVCAEMNRLSARLWPRQIDTAVDKPPVNPSFDTKLTCRADGKLDVALKDHPVLIIPASIRPVAFVDPTEDFTAYTEVDIAENRITITDANTITVTTVDSDESCYVYADKGLNHFAGAWTNLVATWVTAIVGTGFSASHMWGHSDSVGVLNMTGNAVMAFVAGSNNLATRQLYLRHFEAGVQQTTDNAAAGIPNRTTPVYLTFSHAGTTLNCDIYSNALRTAPYLLDTLTIDDDGDARRYVYPMSSRNTATAGRNISMVIEDLDLQEAVGVPKHMQHLRRLHE